MDNSRLWTKVTSSTIQAVVEIQEAMRRITKLLRQHEQELLPSKTTPTEALRPLLGKLERKLTEDVLRQRLGRSNAATASSPQVPSLNGEGLSLHKASCKVLQPRNSRRRDRLTHQACDERWLPYWHAIIGRNSDATASMRAVGALTSTSTRTP